MTKKDILRAQIIESNAFSHPYDMNEVLGGDGKLSLCAFIDGILCGYVCTYYVLDEVNISTIAVSPNYRRLGVGKRLMGALIEKSRQMGMKNIYLEVRYSNAPAIFLYEKMGFVKSGLRKDYYTDPKEDAILYCLDI